MSPAPALGPGLLPVRVLVDLLPKEEPRRGAAPGFLLLAEVGGRGRIVASLA
jgi:hypothetical protein